MISGEILTLAQVAARLQVKARWLRGFIDRKQIRVLRDGRIVRFDELALVELEEAMRCRYASSVAKIQVHYKSPARLPGFAYEDALKLTTVGSQKKKPTT